MGLDMYLYRATRVASDDLKVMNGMSSEEIDKMYPRTLIVTEENLKDEPTLYTELLEYMSPITVKNTYVDLLKLKADHNVHADAIIVGESYDGENVGYSFKTPNDDIKRVSLSYSDMETKYTFVRTDNAHIVYIDEVHYWRKAYEIQDAFYAHRTIENCGYYKLSQEELEAIADKYDTSLYELVDDFPDGVDEALFYHEWY